MKDIIEDLVTLTLHVVALDPPIHHHLLPLVTGDFEPAEMAGGLALALQKDDGGIRPFVIMSICDYVTIGLCGRDTGRSGTLVES